MGLALDDALDLSTKPAVRTTGPGGAFIVPMAIIFWAVYGVLWELWIMDVGLLRTVGNYFEASTMMNC